MLPFECPANAYLDLNYYIIVFQHKISFWLSTFKQWFSIDVSFILGAALTNRAKPYQSESKLIELHDANVVRPNKAKPCRAQGCVKRWRVERKI